MVNALSRRLAPAVALVLAAGLAGCGGDDDDDRAGASSAPAARAGDPLSQQQAQDALLTVEDLPDGWSALPADEDGPDGGGDPGASDSEGTIDPAACDDVLDALEADVGDPDVEAEIGFTRTAEGTLLSQTVASYPDDVDPGFLETIEDAFTECPSFTSTDAAGQVSRVTVSPLSLPDLGDQTLAVSTTYETPSVAVTYDLVFVVTGYNVLTLVSGGLDGADDDELRDTAEAAVAKLAEATA